jgi:hypothetical protein
MQTMRAQQSFLPATAQTKTPYEPNKKLRKPCAKQKQLTARPQRNCFPATARAKKCNGPTTGNSKSATQTKNCVSPT